MVKRCTWCEGHFDEYVQYHDGEWGVPVHDDKKHFEFLVLEGAQAGLSWATVLKRRDGYEKAYEGFDPNVVSGFSKKKIEEMLKDPGIIRNRQKVLSSINNAKCFLLVRKELGSFDDYIWSFVDHTPVVNRWKEDAEIPATSPISDALAKDMKKRGFKFAGSTIMYAHLQACGLVNDHVVDCFRYAEIQRMY